MRVFLINLDKNVNRLKKCDAQLKRLGVDYVRISGICGRELSDDKKKGSIRPFLWWCHAGRRIMDGEIGCALSHISIYKKMIEEGVEIACILEDDVVLDSRFPRQLGVLETLIDVEKPQIVLLSEYGMKNVSLQDESSMAVVKTGSFAEGYILTSLAAKAILKVNYPLRVAADTWGFFRKRGHIQLYQSIPAVCCQDWSDGFVSDVMDCDNNNVKDTIFKCMMYRLGRFVGKIIDHLV